MLSKRLGGLPILRWGGVAFDRDTHQASLEVHTSRDIPFFPSFRSLPKFTEKHIGALIIPTGLGCSIGGFGGDATQSAHSLAPRFDYLVVNPNALNAGAWFNPPPNTLYVEGYALDRFLAGDLGLRIIRSNRLGVIFDAGIPSAFLRRELEVLKAAEVVYGMDLRYEFTDRPMQCSAPPEGHHPRSSLTWESFGPLNSAARSLISQRVEALAIVTLMPELSDEIEMAYREGHGFDPIGGLEALTSHYLSARYGLPCAHAPAFSPVLDIPAKVDRRVSPEITSFSFLPSVLIGLQRAPQLIPWVSLEEGDLTHANLENFAYPGDCWLGRPIESLRRLPHCRACAISSNLTGISLHPGIGSCQAVNFDSYGELARQLSVQRSWGLNQN